MFQLTFTKTSITTLPTPANDRINVQFGDNSGATIILTITDVSGWIRYSGEYNDVRP